MNNKATAETSRSDVTLYHEIAQDKVDRVLKDGLLLSKPGDKEDSLIDRTNKLLDNNIPDNLADLGISRSKALYLYYAKDGLVSDIQDGKVYHVADFPISKGKSLLEVNTSPLHCFISDLDLFDSIKSLLKGGQYDNAVKAAKEYWSNVIALPRYNNSIKRPEVIVTANIPPSDITTLQSSPSK